MSKPEYEYILVHVKMRKDLYEKLWEEVKRRYTIPTRKFHILLNEAIEQYLKSGSG